MLSKFKTLLKNLTHTERQALLGSVLVFAVSAILFGTKSFYSQTTLKPIAGGRYVEGIVGQPFSINPLLASTDTDRDLMEVFFGTLGALSDNMKESDNHTSWTVSLKPDLRWSDGEPLTSDDVVFTLETAVDPETHSPLSPEWQTVNATRLSEREIKFTLRTPYAFFEDSLKRLRIVPRHIFGNIPPANLRLSSYNLEPISSGPYSFVSFDKRKDGFISEYRLIGNKNYASEAPLIKELVFRFFPSYDEAIAAFNRREIDGLGGLDYKSLEKIKIGYETSTMAMPRYYALFLNQNAHPALQDLRVRTALSYAINRNAIVQTVLKNYGLAIYGPLHPGVPGYDPVLDNQKSPEEIGALLDLAGWKKNSEGIRTKIIGGKEIQMDFELITPDVPFLADAASLVREDLQAVGVSIRLVSMSTAEITARAIKTRNYQIILFGNILGKSPDIFSFWHSSERFYPGLNLALYTNRSVDALLESIRKDFDAESRKRALRELQKIIHDDYPAVFLFSPSYIYAHQKSLGGFDVQFIHLPSERLRDVAKWYLKTARVLK